MEQPTDFSALMQLARSPAGQELLALLQRTGGEELNTAIGKAAAGDYAQAKQALSALLDNPEAKKLLRQLGGNP